MANIGQRIKQRRQEMNFTQEELASKMGYKSKSTINKIELGINDIPQSKIAQFAKALNTTVAYLMGWEEMQKKNDTAVGIVKRLGSDKDFCEVVKMIASLDSEQIKGVKSMLSTFLK